jgi:hypothetical protein
MQWHEVGQHRPPWEEQIIIGSLLGDFEHSRDDSMDALSEAMQHNQDCVSSIEEIIYSPIPGVKRQGSKKQRGRRESPHDYRQAAKRGRGRPRKPDKEKDRFVRVHVSLAANVYDFLKDRKMYVGTVIECYAEMLRHHDG